MRQGVPQFVEGYGSEQSMDQRAAPFLAGWIGVWIATRWATSGVAPALAVGGVTGSVAFVVLGFALVRRLRGRSLGRSMGKFDIIEIALFVLLPSVATAVLSRSPAEAVFGGLNLLGGIGLIYLIIAFGLIELGLWALRRLRFQIVNIVTLLARTLPILLILVVFLLFTSEMWEAAHGLTPGELGAFQLLLLLVATVLIVATFRPEIRRLDRRRDWDAMRTEAAGSPAAAFAPEPSGPVESAPPLSWLERRNLDFLVVINQLLQSIFVALLVFAFLVSVAVLLVPGGLQEAWIGEQVRVIGRFDLLGEVRTVSHELVTVCAVLSGIVGLYFTGLALTDATYRAAHFDEVVAELRVLLSVRAVYRAAGSPTNIAD